MPDVIALNGTEPRTIQPTMVVRLRNMLEELDLVVDEARNEYRIGPVNPDTLKRHAQITERLVATIRSIVG